MSNVECSGNEPRLIDCPYSSGGSGSGATLYCGFYDGRCYHRGKRYLVEFSITLIIIIVLRQMQIWKYSADRW